jgi:hypothetical protein
MGQRKRAQTSDSSRAASSLPSQTKTGVRRTAGNVQQDADASAGSARSHKQGVRRLMEGKR